MGKGKTIVRKNLRKIDGVSGTWFEWTFEDSGWVTTLVVEVDEVDMDTDPNSKNFNQGLLDAIEKTAADTLAGETTMVISRLKSCQWGKNNWPTARPFPPCRW